MTHLRNKREQQAGTYYSLNDYQMSVISLAKTRTLSTFGQILVGVTCGLLWAVMFAR